MGTPAIIRVEGNDCAELYKHWDGYPELTLPWLEKFNQQFTEERGIDPAYKLAQLVRSSVYMAEAFCSPMNAGFLLDDSNVTGWGLDAQGTTYGEFIYTLHTDGSVSYTEN